MNSSFELQIPDQTKDVNVKEDKKKMVRRSHSHNVMSLPQSLMIPRTLEELVEWSREVPGKEGTFQFKVSI